MSPDWSAQEEPVPYSKLDDPQSLNLYGYVGNNPMSAVDPDGHNAATDADATACAAANSSGNSCSQSQPDLGADQNRAVAAIDAGGAANAASAQQQSTEQAPDNTLLAQNNTPPPPGRTPAQGGTPDSTVVIPDGKGGSTTRTYGPDGKATTDIDRGHDHGAGDPHAHDWDWGKKPPRQPGRPLTPEEKTQVANGAIRPRRPMRNWTRRRLTIKLSWTPSNTPSRTRFRS